MVVRYALSSLATCKATATAKACCSESTAAEVGWGATEGTSAEMGWGERVRGYGGGVLVCGCGLGVGENKVDWSVRLRREDLRACGGVGGFWGPAETTWGFATGVVIAGCAIAMWFR